MVLKGQDEDSGGTRKEFSAFYYYIKAMTTPLAKGMYVVDPYYFFVCVSLTVSLHTRMNVN